MLAGTTAGQAAIVKWQTSLQARANELQAKYANAYPTAGELLEDVTKWWTIASEFADTARTMGNITPRSVRDAEDNALALLEFRAQLRVQPANATVSPDIRDVGVTLMLGPINWLVRIGSPVLVTQSNYQELAQKAIDAPSSAIGYVLDQLRKSLGLPSWFVPVVAGTAAVGVGAWAYFTFLAPATRISRRLVHQNPRRR